MLNPSLSPLEALSTFGSGSLDQTVINPINPLEPTLAGHVTSHALSSYNRDFLTAQLPVDQVTTTDLDDLPSGAIEVGGLKGIKTYNNSVSATDSSDFYRFNLTGTSNVNLSLTGLTADASVKLFGDFNNNGTIDAGEEIIRSDKGGITDESIAVSGLTAGTYLVQVYQVAGSTAYTLRMSDSPVSELLPTEVNLNPLTAAQVTGTVNTRNTSDTYRFDLSTESRLNLTLTGLTADADVRLIRDANGNGSVDSGEEVARSQLDGTRDEAIVLNTLAAGTYFAQVYQYSGNTPYSLNLTATPTFIPPIDNAGNTLLTARNIGELTTAQTFNDFVGTIDTNDFYRFTLSNTSNLVLTLAGLSADADLELIQDLNNNGVVNPGELLAWSVAGGNTPERIATGLSAGTYYIRVYPYSGNTNYTLTASATAVVLPPGYNINYGYGLVNANAAVAETLGRDPFAAVTDLGGNNWGLDLVNAPEVWANGYTGQNTIVAVVDSGIDYTHPDLDGNIWVNVNEIAGNGIDDDRNGYIDDIRGWDFISNDNNPMDGDGHGTHVAGTIAAENNSFGVTGVAYNARLMPVRVLDDAGFGTWEAIASGIRYAANNGADVINLSLGGSGYSAEVAAAVQYATERGAVVVIASGNEGSNQPSFPANLASQYGIAVGAVDRTTQIASFSNDAGISPVSYVVAPGVSVYSTTPGNTYQNFNGTSMATPHVAGVAALILSANPTLTAAQVTSLLTRTANPNRVIV